MPGCVSATHESVRDVIEPVARNRTFRRPRLTPEQRYYAPYLHRLPRFDPVQRDHLRALELLCGLVPGVGSHLQLDTTSGAHIYCLTTRYHILLYPSLSLNHTY